MYLREQYREFWQWYEYTVDIIMFYNTVIYLLRRERPEWAGDLSTSEYIKLSYTYQERAIQFYRLCSLCDILVDSNEAHDTFEQMIYDAPSKENRKHIFSNLLPDLRFVLKTTQTLTSTVILPENATEDDIDSAIRKHLQQDSPPNRTAKGNLIVLLNYIVSLFELKKHNAKKIYEYSLGVSYYIDHLITQIEYLAKIYDIDLTTLPSRYEEANTAPMKCWPVSRYRTMRVTPFGENYEICVDFISRELQTRPSKPAKLLATIILAMERTGAVDTLCSQTELLNYLAQYIPNLPTRQGVSKHIATYKSAANRFVRSYGGITDGEVEAMEQKIKDFTTKTNS